MSKEVEKIYTSAKGDVIQLLSDGTAGESIVVMNNQYHICPTLYLAQVLFSGLIKDLED